MWLLVFDARRRMLAGERERLLVVFNEGKAEEIVGGLLKDCRDEWIVCSKFQGRTPDPMTGVVRGVM